MAPWPLRSTICRSRWVRICEWFSVVAASLRIWGLTPYAVDASGFDVKDTWKLVMESFTMPTIPFGIVHIVAFIYIYFFMVLGVPIVRLIDPSDCFQLWSPVRFWGGNFAIFMPFHVPFEGRLQCNWSCMPLRGSTPPLLKLVKSRNILGDCFTIASSVRTYSAKGA